MPQPAYIYILYAYDTWQSCPPWCALHHARYDRGSTFSPFRFFELRGSSTPNRRSCRVCSNLSLFWHTGAMGSGKYIGDTLSGLLKIQFRVEFYTSSAEEVLVVCVGVSEIRTRYISLGVLRGTSAQKYVTRSVLVRTRKSGLPMQSVFDMR